MNAHEQIRSQFQAALDMLQQAISRCPETLWSAPEHQNPFWQIAYHALFYTHLYVQPSLAVFTPWAKHRQSYERMESLPRSPHEQPKVGELYDKQDVLEYLSFCRQEIDRNVPGLDLDGASGFDWLPFGKLELQFYSLRHLQQHIGELCERLTQAAGIEIDWVSVSS